MAAGSDLAGLGCSGGHGPRSTSKVRTGGRGAARFLCGLPLLPANLRAWSERLSCWTGAPSRLGMKLGCHALPSATAPWRTCVAFGCRVGTQGLPIDKGRAAPHQHRKPCKTDLLLFALLLLSCARTEPHVPRGSSAGSKELPYSPWALSSFS